MAAANPYSSFKAATAGASPHALWNKSLYPEPMTSTASSHLVTPVIVPVIASSASTGAEVATAGGSESVSASNGNAGKKPAWSSPSSGPEVGAAMEVQSWPSLAESVKDPTEPSLLSVKALADGLSSMSISQGTEPEPPQKHSAKQRHGNSSVNHHPVSTRQRSMKQNGAATSGDVLSRAPPLPEQSVGMWPRLSPGYHNPRNNFASQFHGFNDHPRQHHNSFRNRNGSIHPRGSFNYQNFGGWHNQQHGNQIWASNRSFVNSRDHRQKAIPGPIRPPPPPYVPYAPLPSSVWCYSPIGYPEEASSSYYVPAPARDLQGAPFPLSPQSDYVPTIDPPLHTKILHQIEYYFSVENLVKDTFLRQNMDEQGWVPISLIAGFRKVLNLTDNKSVILDSLQASTVVELQGDKIRRRNDWMRWIMPYSFQVSSSTAPQASF
ncbi:hypothetical protein SAY86_017022 [Trapa natans]|uniref:HTH La-type RNA-binding domain-containing protein n=1 Tax=Trapa natans TaxID=22666 RepID=A0AAN7LJZ5_TRANT|nr:hypothetical protein SAY86_017022 [Trapa natans]